MDQKMQVSQSRPYRSGPLRRVSAPDLQLAVELFVDAASTLTPDDQTQRRAFEALMPNMFVLRNKGASWAQLTDLLSKAGFLLQQSTVRTYYSEMLVRQFDACQERMNQQIALLKSIKKETEGVELAGIASRVSDVMQRNRDAVAPRLREILGEPATAPRVPVLNPAKRTEAQPQRPAARRTGVAAPKPLTAPPQRTEPELRSGGHFGLTQGPSTPPQNQRHKGNTAAFQNPEETDPSVPILKSSPGPVNPTKGMSLGCMRLQDGVSPLKARPEIPASVYQEGNLEHPAIPGLMLSLAQRIYGAMLEYKDMDSGELYTETPDERRFRVMWKAPIPKTQTSTAGSFIKTDMSLFGPREGNPK